MFNAGNFDLALCQPANRRDRPLPIWNRYRDFGQPAAGDSRVFRAPGHRVESSEYWVKIALTLDASGAKHTLQVQGMSPAGQECVSKHLASLKYPAVGKGEKPSTPKPSSASPAARRWW